MIDAENYLREKFLKFYSRNKVEWPSSIERREFGFGSFKKKIVSRHSSFNSLQEFNSFLRQEAPLFVSYSTAYYEKPSMQPMEKKGFQGADIIYEFDADDIQTSCKQKHDSWQCTNPECNAKGVGRVEKCSACGSAVRLDEWVCPECLDEVKKQAMKLIDLIKQDFSFKEGIKINFSGSKGFHIHIISDEVKKLSNQARIELVDYISLQGIDFNALGYSFDNGKFYCPVKELGISKKLNDFLRNVISGYSAEKLAAITGSRVKECTEFLSQKKAILDSMNKGTLYPLPGRKTEKFWNRLLDYAVESEALKIDRQTSVDLSKIIRVPGTLHGDTGLKAALVKDLASFNALQDSVVFSAEKERVFVSFAPKFYLNGVEFGPFNEEEALLPEFAAVYLIAKGKAKPVK